MAVTDEAISKIKDMLIRGNSRPAIDFRRKRN